MEDTPAHFFKRSSNPNYDYDYDEDGDDDYEIKFRGTIVMATFGSPFNELLLILQLASTAAQEFPNPAVDAGAALASKLIQIIQAANAAHHAVTGQPIDPSLLQPIAEVP